MSLDWLEHSLLSGTQLKCVQISVDSLPHLSLQQAGSHVSSAARALPLHAHADGTTWSQRKSHRSPILAKPAASDAMVCQFHSRNPFSMLPMAVAAVCISRKLWCAHRLSYQHCRLCPMKLLDGLHWAVSENIEYARLDDKSEHLPAQKLAEELATEMQGSSLNPQDTQLLCGQFSRPEVCNPQSLAGWVQLDVLCRATHHASLQLAKERGSVDTEKPIP